MNSFINTHIFDVYSVFIFVDQAEKLIVHWSDEHEGVLPLDFLSENAYSDVTNEFQPSSVFSLPKTFPTLEFSEVSSGSQGVLK